MKLGNKIRIGVTALTVIMGITGATMPVAKADIGVEMYNDGVRSVSWNETT